MIRLKICFIAIIFGLLLMASCSKDDSSSAPTVSDQETAELFAWAVKTSFQYLAPDSETKTWSSVTLSGFVSGSAVINGSFTYDYDAYSGRKDEKYNNVVITFDNYCDDEYYPHLSGTVIIDGTCTTQYGYNTTYYGQWELVGENIKLSGELSGTASVAMGFKRGGLDWAAMVQSADGNWNISY